MKYWSHNTKCERYGAVELIRMRTCISFACLLVPFVIYIFQVVVVFILCGLHIFVVVYISISKN